MPRTKISEFSSTPASNTDIDSINIAEGCAPSGINDAIRELMAQLKDWQSGTSNDPMVIGSSGSLTLNQGTANGVAYLNGSKVVTSGSALTFDGNTLTAVNTSGNAIIASRGSKDLRLTGNYAGANTHAAISTTTGMALAFMDESSEYMRLTSTGLGIGTSSPAVKLDVSGSVNISSGQNLTWGGAYAANIPTMYAVSGASGYFYWSPRGNTGSFMTLDANSNLGLGVTPSAWGSGYTAFQMQNVGRSLAATGSGSGDLTLAFNAVYDNTDGRWEYAYTGDKAGRYSQTGAGNHVWYVTNTTGTAGNAITFTQALTLNASGQLLVGTTSAAGSERLNIVGGTGIRVNEDGVGTKILTIRSDYAGLGPAINVTTNDPLLFLTNNTERCRIDSSGNLLVGATSSIASERLYLNGSNANYITRTYNSNANPYGALFSYTGAAPNGTANEFFRCDDTGAVRMTVRSNGGIANYSANNVNLSDERTKTNIQNAGGYLAKICAIPVRTFKYKDQSDDLLNLGVIAQEVETVAPELVDMSGFGETPEDGIPLKAIYQTDLQYALMKCIQEQQAIIESLKARLDAANL